jgi:hypothetical protein
VCGQPVYRFGWHVDLWDSGANKNANWHLRLRDRLGILECAEWRGRPPAAPACAALRPNWQTAMEER